MSIGQIVVLLAELDQFRKKRNLSTYEYAGAISDYEADRMIELAKALRDRVIAWLREFHPELIELNVLHLSFKDGQ